MNKVNAIIYALLAAVFYAINVPASKVLLLHVGPTTMATLLYLGAGIGIGALSLFKGKANEEHSAFVKELDAAHLSLDPLGDGCFHSAVNIPPEGCDHRIGLTPGFDQWL